MQDASHQLVMITGDAPLTACHAASQVHILDRPVLILVHKCAIYNPMSMLQIAGNCSPR